ncbi:acid protease [Teratosphaeria destructans]|uniref:Acid protease n=1 Tax=Teratosphaeria destructans TaxID=418781 RepID=A0A9W7SW30_9PEZI|nr:acid protease [Teratosphaeria destructans]
MRWTTSLTALFLLQDFASASLQERSNAGSFRIKDVAKTRNQPAALSSTGTILSLKKAGRTGKGSNALQRNIRTSSATNTTSTNHTTQLISAEYGAGFAINITFGDQVFEVIMDTGSSDLWLADSSVECVNDYLIETSVASCGFGPLADSTFQNGQISNENFNISYGDGEFLTGVLGYEDVSLGDVTVQKQEVALVDYAFWEGDSVTSGLMGFAYPSLTSAFEGDDPAADDDNRTAAHYTNWIFSAIEQGLIVSYFSLALERDSGDGSGNGGQLALGGLPDVDFNQSWTSTPLKIAELTPHAQESTNFSYYTIIPDGFLLIPATSNNDTEGSSSDGGEGPTEGEGSGGLGDPSSDSPGAGSDPAIGGARSGSKSFFQNSKKTAPRSQEADTEAYPVIVDSGTTLVYLPYYVAEEINAAFDPPSVYIEEEGVYENDCGATPPELYVRINGTDFPIAASELLLQGELGEDPYTGGCVTGIQPTFDEVYILGDVFLKNVVAVFDVGASEMRFAEHSVY